MNSRGTIALGGMVLVAALAGRCGAQGVGLRVVVSDTTQSTSHPLPADQVVRAIDDPYAGGRWLLMRDTSHPAGPGVLVYAMRNAGKGRQVSSKAEAAGMADAFRPVIRAGDRVVVEESTAVVEARLEAVALGPALRGARFDARLAIGGHVVRAVALEAGRAALVSELEVRQ